MTAPGPWRAAIIGCGRVGSLLERDPLRGHPCTHAGLYAAHPRTSLVAGCDRHPGRRAAFARDWGIPAARVYEDHRNLLDAERLDIVSIATWTDSHAEITAAAARAGVRVILCEKPMAIDLAQADRMIEICRDMGVVLAIHHERRWERSYRAVKRWIEEGRIGEVRTVVGNVLTGEPHPDWHAHPSIAGGGPSMHDGTHLFDLLRFLFGGVTEMRGETERRNPDLRVEDTGRAVLRLPGGAVAFVECGGRRKYFNFEVDIQGTTGRIRIGNALREHYGIGPSARYEGFTEFTARPFPEFEEAEYFPFIIDELIGACEEGRPSISSGEDGRAALELVLSLYRAPRPLTAP